VLGRDGGQVDAPRGGRHQRLRPGDGPPHPVGPLIPVSFPHRLASA
jgi:hypothetical protein